MGGEDRTTSCLGVKRVLREPEEEGRVFVAGEGGGGEGEEEGGGSEAVSSKRGRLAGGGTVVGEEMVVTVESRAVECGGECCRLAADCADDEISVSTIDRGGRSTLVAASTALSGSVAAATAAAVSATALGASGGAVDSSAVDAAARAAALRR